MECLSRKTHFLTTYVISSQVLAIRLENPVEASVEHSQPGARPAPSTMAAASVSMWDGLEEDVRGGTRALTRRHSHICLTEAAFLADWRGPGTLAAYL